MPFRRGTGNRHDAGEVQASDGDSCHRGHLCRSRMRRAAVIRRLRCRRRGRRCAPGPGLRDGSAVWAVSRSRPWHAQSRAGTPGRGRPRTPTREPRCRMTEPEAAWSGRPLILSPPTSRALPGSRRTGRKEAPPGGGSRQAGLPAGRRCQSPPCCDAPRPQREREPPIWRPRQFLRSSVSGMHTWLIWRRHDVSVEVRRPARVTEQRREAAQHEHGPGDVGKGGGEHAAGGGSLPAEDHAGDQADQDRPPRCPPR